jgi:hypothetical protein
MNPDLIRSLRDRRADIRTRWESLLRSELATTSLANPDLLVRLCNSTLDEIFTTLQAQPGLRRSAPASHLADLREACACGRNPLLAYFLAGEQALLETLLLLDAAHGGSDTAAAELYLIIRSIARREVGSFCSLCQHRAAAPGRPPPVSRPFRQASPLRAVSIVAQAIPIAS